MPSPVKILIVEDEMIIAARLSMLLESMGYEVAGIIPRGEEAVKHCRDTPPDILLLDINLKGLLNGIETAQVIQKDVDIPLIYLTANTDEGHFEQAKQTRPYAFLAKPYNQTDLQRAIELVVERINDRPLAQKTEEPEDSYMLSDRIFVRHQNTMVKVFLKDILYVEAERSYCRITAKDTEYLLSMPLKELDEKLQPAHFFRLHRSYIVNLLQLDTVGESHVTISGKAIPLGKSYREEFLRRVQLI